MPRAEPILEDAQVPGAAVVLAPALLEEWLAERLRPPCAVVPHRLRYKAGTSVVLGFSLTTGHDGPTERCVARAYAAEAAAKAAKDVAKSPPGSVLAHDAGLRLVVTTMAGDRAIPVLGRLAEPEDVARRLSPGDPRAVRLRTLRHNPGRRWVGVLEQDGAAPLLVRAYDGPARMRAAAECYRALGGRDEVSGPQAPWLVGRSRRLAAIAVTWAEGTDLASSGTAGDWRAAGTELARLHDRSGRRLRTRRPALAAEAVAATCDQIALLLPGLAADVLAAGQEVRRLLERTGGEGGVGEGRATHGDFSADQVVVGARARPVIVDLDAARRGAAAYDLGCLVATTPSGDTRLLDAFASGYEDVRAYPASVDVAVHAVAFRLRKAVEPFRDCAPDWPARVTERVRAACAALDDLLVTGARR
ncbi:MAG: hypothetical protein J7518_01160 [Nocardioidaceae bacterium]|nr:hypothetical protein [Nocardioidaceae bacterium]